MKTHIEMCIECRGIDASEGGNGAKNCASANLSVPARAEAVVVTGYEFEDEDVEEFDEVEEDEQEEENAIDKQVSVAAGGRKGVTGKPRMKA